MGDQSWKCPVCTFINTSQVVCECCGDGFPPVPDNKWRCKACTLVNPIEKPTCAVCNAARPKDIKVPVPVMPNRQQSLSSTSSTSSEAAAPPRPPPNALPENRYSGHLSMNNNQPRNSSHYSQPNRRPANNGYVDDPFADPPPGDLMMNANAMAAANQKRAMGEGARQQPRGSGFGGGLVLESVAPAQQQHRRGDPLDQESDSEEPLDLAPAAPQHASDVPPPPPPQARSNSLRMRQPASLSDEENFHEKQRKMPPPRASPHISYSSDEDDFDAPARPNNNHHRRNQDLGLPEPPRGSQQLGGGGLPLQEAMDRDDEKGNGRQSDPFGGLPHYQRDPNKRPSLSDHIRGDMNEPPRAPALPRPGPAPVAASSPNNDLAIEDEDPTQALIRQLLQAELCGVCKNAQGICVSDSCGHYVCQSCVKRYIIDGITRNTWANKALTCPEPDCQISLPRFIWNKIGPPESQMLKRLEEMVQSFNMNQQQGLVTCPNEKCGQKFIGEPGKYEKGVVETGVFGKRVTEEEQRHKAQWRFRCPKCQENFCGNCFVTPYHLGATCETYKKWQESKKCRFCDSTIERGMARRKAMDKQYPALQGNVCLEEECNERANNSCGKLLPCGHNCLGIRHERKCPPCLVEDCPARQKDKDKTEDDYCPICWTEALKAAPCVRLDCGHWVHYHCIRHTLEAKWTGARITFNYMRCPECKKDFKTFELRHMLSKHEQLKRKVEDMAVKQLKQEGLHNDPRLRQKGGKYFNNVALFSMDRLAYYMCFKCKKPYYGGMRKCDAQGLDKFNPEHLLCGGCRQGPDKKTCKIHGTQFIVYKCRFCCKIASWFCWGNTHFCHECHKRQEGGDYLNRKPMSAHPVCQGTVQRDASLCPLKVIHPPNGKNFCLGCSVCNTA